MGNVPVWAVGCVLRMAGVPCPEEIAIMLERVGASAPETPMVPQVPDTVDTLQVLGGSYVDGVYFNGDGKAERTVTFLVGEFPLEQSFKWNYHWGWDTAYGTKIASLALRLVNLPWANRVGDFIKLRYTLPQITRCKFYNTDSADGSVYKNPDYYSFRMSLEGEDADCTVTHSSDSGIAGCSDGGLLADSSFTPVLDGNTLLGFELSGYLQHPVTAVEILISGHKSVAYNNADLTVQYSSHEDLTVEVYEVGAQ